MSKKDDFFAENERFRRLIRLYAYRLHDREAEADMWSFLWELLNSGRTIPNERYIAVCLRNYFIKKSKDKTKHSSELPLLIEVEDVLKDVDLSLDLRTGMLKLKPSDRDIIFKKYYCGKSFEEIAKECGTTRQSQSQRCKNAVLRLRDILKSGTDEDFYS